MRCLVVVVVAAMAVAVAVAVVVVAVASSDGMTVRSSSTAGVEDGDAANANRAVTWVVFTGWTWLGREVVKARDCCQSGVGMF